MKTFNQLLTELYTPLPDDKDSPEIKFMKKHVITQFGVKDGKDYAGNSVDGPPYKGKVDYHKRPPMHGYDSNGQDTQVYD